MGHEPAWRVGVREMLEGTGCEIDRHVSSANGPQGRTVAVTCLTATLRPGRENLTLARRAGNGRWYIVSPEEFVRGQRLRQERVRPNESDRGLLVDAVLARRLRAIPNRSTARRQLFALSQGAEAKVTEWSDIQHTAVRDGMIYATLTLGAEVSWRNGELRIKGRQLPETTMAALGGRHVSTIADIRMLDGIIMERARNGPDGIIARCVCVTERYADVWRDLGGE